MQPFPFSMSNPTTTLSCNRNSAISVSCQVHQKCLSYKQKFCHFCFHVKFKKKKLSGLTKMQPFGSILSKQSNRLTYFQRTCLSWSYNQLFTALKKKLKRLTFFNGLVCPERISSLWPLLFWPWRIHLYRAGEGNQLGFGFGNIRPPKAASRVRRGSAGQDSMLVKCAHLWPRWILDGSKH